MDFDENELPQKQRLPRALKIYGREDSEWRENCPINGTRLFDKPKPLTLEAKSAYSNRKVRKARKMARKRELGGEIQGEGSGGNMAKRSKTSSPSGGTPYIPSTVHSPTSIPQGAFHMWSIDDPLAPTVLIDQQPPPAQASPVPSPPSYLPISLSAAQGQCSANIHCVDDDIQPSSYTTVMTSSSKTEWTHEVDDVHVSPSSSTTLWQEAYNNGPSICQASMQPAGQQWSEQPGTSAISPSTYNASVLSPALSADQDDGWNTDEFIAVYKSFFVPRPSASRHSDHRALALDSMDKHDADTPHRTIQEPTPAPLAYSMATESMGSTIGVIMGNGTGEMGPRDMSQSLNTAYVAQPEDSEPIAWSTPPVDIAQIDHERLRDVVNTATNFEYALNYATDVHDSPLAIPSSIHPRPPKLSSYSELAPASNFPASAFADHHILPPTDALTATFHTTTPSAFADALLHDHRSACVLGTYSQDPVYLTQPYVVREVAVNAGEYARALEGGFEDVNKPFSADIIKPPLPNVDLVTGLAQDAVNEVEYTSIFQERIARSDPWLSKTKLLPLNLRAPWRQQRHDASMNSF